MHFEGHFAFQNAQNNFFQKNWKQILGYNKVGLGGLP